MFKFQNIGYYSLSACVFYISGPQFLKQALKLYPCLDNCDIIVSDFRSLHPEPQTDWVVLLMMSKLTLTRQFQFGVAELD